jgi:hypothetical protein
MTNGLKKIQYNLNKNEENIMAQNWMQPIPIEVYDITKEGFKLRIHRKEYYLEREIFRWFLNATDEEILDVVAYPCVPDTPDYRGDHLSWGLLNVDLRTGTLENPELFLKYLPKEP